MESAENKSVDLLPAIKAAKELFDHHLSIWRQDTKILNWLKQQDESFESKEFCSLKVIAIDSLYSTNLRFHPGRRAELASHIYRHRKTLNEVSEQKPNWALVIELAAQASKGDGNVSFASKFFQFFVSDKYPIFDALAQKALEKCRPDLGKRPYTVFADSITTLSKINSSMTIREIDRYLWLLGNYLEWKRDIETQKEPSKKLNEIQRLFQSDNGSVRELLKTLTADEYRPPPHHDIE